MFKSKITLTSHHQYVHSKKFSCETCSKTFGVKERFKDHMSTFHKNDEFKCSKCLKSFQSEMKVRRHQQRFHGTKKFHCDDCDAAFRIPSELEEHIQVKHEGKRWHCSYPDCKSHFTLRASAIKHLSKIHKSKGKEHKEYCKNLALNFLY